MKVVIDIECDGLEPSKIFCAVAKDVDTQEVYEFDKVWLDYKPLQDFIKKVDKFIGHHLLGYDVPVLNDLAHTEISPESVVDTLVVSRLINFSRPSGHGLESYGEEFDIIKPKQEQWDEYEPKMLYRCKQDVEINHKVYLKYLKYIESPRWQKALKIEHSTADYCRRLHDNGFPFDIVGARSLLADREKERADLEAAFRTDFPPVYEPIREIHPRLTQQGRLHSKDFRWFDGDPNEVFQAGAPFSLVRQVEFDPASKQQCIDRLLQAGWRPVNRTDGHKDYLRLRKADRDPARLARFERYGWTLDPQNLDTLPATAPKSAKSLSTWLQINGKIKQLEEWVSRYDEKTGRIHGRFMAIGAWSGRCAHAAPNMANASSDHVVRALWTSTPDTVLVGCDAEGIQLRVLAHYMNDDRFTQAVQGDVHTLNAEALGHVAMRWKGSDDPKKSPRAVAKKFIYSWLLGAQAGKLAMDMECKTQEASQAMKNFLEFYPGLKQLKEVQIPADAMRGYFEGLDGRMVRQIEERLMLAGYLQNGESVVMKLARMLWENDLKKVGIWYQPVNFIHDEWVTLAKPEDAEEIGRVQAQSITRAGQILNVRCPLSGSPKIGKSWDEVH